MPRTFDQKLLLGKWRHSHEDDTGTTTVFRRASDELPPSRGRIALQFQPGGNLVYQAPGPTDRTETSTGRWSVDAQGRVVLSVPGRMEQAWDIQSLEQDRLIIKKT